MDYLINLFIAVFGSLSGAAAGCWLAHKYLRRSTLDAISEAKAVSESHEMRLALLGCQGKIRVTEDYPGLPMVTQSGERFYIKNIEHVGIEVAKLLCSTNKTEMQAAQFGKMSRGCVRLFRFDSIIELALPVEIPEVNDDSGKRTERGSKAD